MNIPTRYDLGDVVWHVHKLTARRAAFCGLCAGDGWVAIAADATKRAICPDCHGRRYSQTEMVYEEPRATISRLTLGLVDVRVLPDSTTVRYMADETGIGSGSMHEERDLYPSYEEAMAECDDAVVIFDARGHVLVNRGSADELVSA